MNRRMIVSAAALTLASATLRVLAQPARKIRRVGFLMSRTRPPSLDADFLGTLAPELAKLGLVEGRDITIEWHFSDGQYGGLSEAARELVRVPVDVIFAGGTPAARAAQEATSTIPIVIAGTADPVATGLVRALGRPGGNITGVTNLAIDLSGKMLEYLRAIAPRMTRVAVLYNPTNPIGPIVLKQVEVAAAATGVTVSALPADTLPQVDAAFATMTEQRPGALIVAPDPFYLGVAPAIAARARSARLPAIYAFPQFVEAGGLMSYGQDLGESYRLAMPYIAKILQGARPDTLPVEQATKVVLVINLVAARAIEVTVPQSLLIRADRVIS